MNRYRKLRTVAALLLFVAIVLLFLDFTGVTHAYLGWLAEVQLLPALLALNVGVVGVLIVLTLLFGRLYCSVICPLGVMQDIVARLGRKAKRNRYGYSKAKTLLRVVVLVLFGLLIALGLTSWAALIAPYSAFGRIATNLLQPLWMWGNNLLAMGAEWMDSYAFYRVEVLWQGVVSLVVSLVTLFVVGLLAWKHGRTWCNTICPVGTLLGFFARFSWLRPVIDRSKCNGCGLCARNC
ncbi:MAG: 4Fe-4S binding protein, partial [Alistipes sp.]|nr:4Fe-4S binding protein [Alistipes sp.]